MKKVLVLILTLIAFKSYSQCGFTAADTVTSNTVTLITYNSARINGDASNGDVGGNQIVLKYVRVGQVDTTISTTAWPTVIRNLTGLQASTTYVYYYSYSCGSQYIPQSVAYYFTTLANTISYKPEYMPYQYGYIKVDSGFKVPRRDTSLGRAPNTGGDIVFKTSDGIFYGYNGTYWLPLAVDSAGIISMLNDKVDSVTVAGDSLWYWKLGVSYGYILPTQANEWKLLGNAGTTAGTNFVGTTDDIDLVFKRNSVESGRLNGDNTSFGVSSLAALTSGTANTAIGNSAMAFNTDGSGNTAIGSSSLFTNTTGTGNISIGGSAGRYTNLTDRLYINSFDRTDIPGDTTESIIYGAQDASAANQRLYLNSRVFAPYIPSGVGTHAVRYDPTTDEFTYADTTTGGGSGANTALSNLASVAINTSLLPGVSDNIDLGSTTFQWRNLYLGEGQKIDWDNGDATLTQVGNNVTLDGAAFLVTSPEQTPASFSSSFAGNMQVNWNSTTGNNVNFVFQDAGTARWYIGNNSSTGSDRLHILNQSAAEAITVLQGLQVGINQTAPTARLHIGAGAATANYAPLKFTTGTNNTTAEAGAMEYTTPQLFFTNGRAVRQELFQGQQARVSVQYDNTTTTLGNVTGLTANVAASGTYRFEAKLYTTSDVAGGIKVAIGGTATATAIRYEGLTTDAGLTTQGRATALGTAVGAVTAVTAAYVVITGTITVNAAGTLTVQAAANAATGTTSVLTGSTFVITEML